MTFSQRMLWGAALLGLAIGGAIVLYPALTLPGTTSICLSMDTVADYIHAVIEADRDSYTRHVVERMQAKGIVVASENWEDMHTLPLPAQFLLESGRHLDKKGIGVQYRLISLWPINKRSVATTPLQSIALGTIVTQPNHPFTGVMKVGNTRYYEAVYQVAKIATLPGVRAPSRTGCSPDGGHDARNRRGAYGGSHASFAMPSVFSITPRIGADLLAAFTICTTTGIVASLPTASVDVSTRSRSVKSPFRCLTAFARSMTCGKSTFHGCGGTYGHLVM